MRWALCPKLLRRLREGIPDSRPAWAAEGDRLPLVLKTKGKKRELEGMVSSKTPCKVGHGRVCHEVSAPKGNWEAETMEPISNLVCRVVNNNRDV